MEFVIERVTMWGSDAKPCELKKMQLKEFKHTTEFKSTEYKAQTYRNTRTDNVWTIEIDDFESLMELYKIVGSIIIDEYKHDNGSISRITIYDDCVE